MKKIVAVALTAMAVAACNSNDHYLVSCNDYTDAGVFWNLVSVTENSDGNLALSLVWIAVPSMNRNRRRWSKGRKVKK